MKFIHTADWHLGNKMHDSDRTKEVSFFLEWLKNQITETGSQALIISGDIFDTANPPNLSKTQYANFLAALQDSCCKNIIVVGGNHDSGDLLDTEKAIFSHLNIHIAGSLSNTTAEELVFELFDEEKKPLAICAAVPFAHECELRNYLDQNTDGEDGTFSDRAYGALYKKVLEKAIELRGTKNIPIIATGHLYAANLEGRFENQQKENRSDDGRRVLDVVGKLGSVHENVFPEEFDYVALGHIHYTTAVGNNPKIMYSGSPFVMGFDEAQIPRNVLCVEALPGETSVTKIQIPSIVTYRRLSGDSKTIRTLLEEYKKNPPEKPTFLELYYKLEDGININDLLENLISELEKKDVFVVSRKVQSISDFFINDGTELDGEEVKNLDAEEIFENLILAKSKDFLNGNDENENKKIQDEILKKYLHIFTEAYDEFLSEPSV